MRNILLLLFVLCTATLMAQTTHIDSLRVSAEAGNAGDQYELGISYYYGRDVVRSEVLADKWFKAAFKSYKKRADEGDAEASLMVGQMYNLGMGVKQNNNKAFQYYQIAAREGYTLAYNNIANCYETGQGVKKDIHEAIKWYTLAAEKGLANAQYALGDIYLGVEHNVPKGIEWYTKAAEQDDSNAVIALAELYAQGKQVTQDYTEALKWYSKGANLGDWRAQYNMGVFLYKGQNVTVDYEKSAMWLLLAAAQCPQDYMENVTFTRDRSVKMLTPEQYRQAQDDARAMQAEIDKLPAHHYNAK